ncbi:uncharacterized protein LOC118186125 isoform X2 [Stegodyphus dumicola]|uniref:uncharacterized protein LOC118186125 isoform X2 n=1 Tax=Stegodyphus dumicola TaxID=202533 RepID=UPI0015AF0452|nr:uncharacterized protein LOC118186125 isoform X2 [Stegodyphus dumicola]
MVISKAMLFAHMAQRSKEVAKYDPAMLAAATLTLSCKSYDETLSKTMVVLTFHHMIKKEYLLNLLSEKKFNLDKYLEKTEHMLFRVLGGNTSQKIAHEYVLFFTRNLIPVTEVGSCWQTFNTTVWKIISDFYMLELFSPDLTMEIKNRLARVMIDICSQK